ncbi:hypothetical protein Gotri_026610 [Gossypium trilobum]|uniref:Uncharacterized protein n=1 Tax=Gossypium trilobum TaxID=34281 RepID=A0A7J9FTL1_9ROSI|nr:hypothetical protein [Gossypium trilobum]
MHLVILLFNLLLNNFLTKTNPLMKPFMLLLRLSVR